mmetsp:Transcript_20895/g.25343  ORF Transcript_20895/g.25343 Transcript_20895/m.25343 type:complete len:304 (+) Transcript_20895:275-1186(+)|eukprot:CAMPEP_0204830370 /NCGR_PEP_ID=MMETSP1346-20131115/8498_1 /ASSEMBLY_ACC=CAM_ASM_000771 /TAXON_ID=215587 /ORGANISM="Aplanochytrium stocchinoi, Strain GSBS06" /LENGTH=303 /DNA_ID=CAMNT_0051960561 /DNA_START=67 /DNA_END=978 /DNA_ORIENTATION=+
MEFSSLLPLSCVVFFLISSQGFVAGATLYSESDSVLKAAIDAAGFTSLLDDPNSGPYTLLAPANSAFTPFLPDIVYEYNKDILQTILKHHVLKKEYLAVDIDGRKETLNKDKVDVDTSGTPSVTSSGGVEAKITVTDVQTDNGILHRIDTVLIPKNADIPEYRSILEVLKAKGSFDILVKLLEDNNLDSVLDSPSVDGFTLFAPNDKAFEKLLKETGFADLDELTANVDVATVLKYHVHPFAETRNAIRRKYKKADMEMLVGSIRIKGCTKIKTSSGQKAKVIAHERRTLNGYVHVIDEVLLP